MKKKYYEVVFEGHYKGIFGLLEGFILGSGKEYEYYFSKNTGIQSETLGEIILEFVTMQTKLHHVIMDEKFHKDFDAALSKKKASKFLSKKYVRSAELIIEASFEFQAKTYGKKYGSEIKAILNNLTKNLELHNYNPKERETEEGKGVEMYAPEHDYIFEATGKVSGDLSELIAFRKKLEDHALIEVQKIKLVLEKQK